MRAMLAALLALIPAAPADEPLQPWGSNHHPTDVPKRHVEELADARHAYAVAQGGTMDGTNCRAPLSVAGTLTL